MIIDVEKAMIEGKVEHGNALDHITGLAPNTIRLVTDFEASRLRGLQSIIADDQPVTINLIDTETKQPMSRRVTHISLHGPILGHWIANINWRHMSLEGGE
ncbi:MAG: hypothetical protein WC891_02880 [Actinomycetota bacterium]